VRERREQSDPCRRGWLGRRDLLALRPWLHAMRRDLQRHQLQLDERAAWSPSLFQSNT
jgi:hypothetical protein